MSDDAIRYTWTVRGLTPNAEIYGSVRYVREADYNRLLSENERLAKENTKLTDVLLSKHGGEPLALLDELDQARADNEALLNLLAVIHRDGGHYTGKHGVIKSADDAATVVITLRLLLAEACEWSACPNEESEYGFRHCCNTADWEPHIDGCRFHAALGERR